jgi:uncharacterized RDD family membrane protein YckC
MNFTPKPAPIAKRVTAGFIDAAFLAVLSGITFVMPLMLWGIVLPMWGVLTVLVGYAVVPIAFFKRTLGLHIMGLEVVGKTGHPLDLANTTFRELLGRGFFPFAYLFTAVMSLVAMRFHLGGSIAPPVLAGVMTFASATAFAVAAMGHLIALGRPDGRTLADLISGSFVVEGPALPKPTDPDELDELAAQRGRVIRNVIIFEVVCALSVLGVPALLMSKGSETPSEKAQRLKTEALRAKFDATPQSESLAKDLEYELRAAGRFEDAKQVWDKHVEALSLREAKREEDLRAMLAEKRDRQTAQTLINLLEQQDRVDEAREVYLQWLGETPTPSELAGFGHWLATNGKTEEAVTVLTTATTQDPLVPYGHTLLGVSLQRMGRLAMAREELELALLDDPDDEDAADALQEVTEQLGDLTAADKAKLKKRFDAWAKDAGR